MTRRRVALAVTLLALLSAVPACSDTSGTKGGGTTAGSTAAGTGQALRDPTATDLADLKQRMSALPNVTAVTLTFTARTFEHGSLWDVGITSNAPDQAALDDTVDKALRILWTAPGITWGTVSLGVANPDTRAVSQPRAIGVNPDDAAALEKRYGPKPSG